MNVTIEEALLTEPGEYPARVAEHADQLRSTRPVDPDRPVRAPFERSAAERAARIVAGVPDVSDTVVDRPRAVVAGDG